MKINNFVLIVGAMKCGTNSLFNYLSQHPQISPCRYKEPHFFENPNCFYKGFDYYQSLWDWNPDIHKIALEATPDYTKFTHPKNLNAAENIFQVQTATNANFKFIYIMRNPIDRIESHYNHLNFRNPDVTEITDWMIDASKYAMQIQEYYKRFSKDSILLLNFDDLKNQPFNVLKKICVFLELEPDYKFQGINNIYNQHEHKVRIRLPGWSKVRKNRLIYSITQSISYENRQKIKMYFLGKKSTKKIKLSYQQKKNILNFLRDDLRKLKYDYNFDITTWKL
jgi:hypothetical protein